MNTATLFPIGADVPLRTKTLKYAPSVEERYMTEIFILRPMGNIITADADILGMKLTVIKYKRGLQHF